jgi:hypothetical protein
MISDKITVLRDGEIIDSDTSNNFDRARIVKAMIGRDLSESAYAENIKLKKSYSTCWKKDTGSAEYFYGLNGPKLNFFCLLWANNWSVRTCRIWAH